LNPSGLSNAAVLDSVFRTVSSSQKSYEAAPAKCLIRKAAFSDMPTVTGIYANFVQTSTATFELVAPDQAEMTHRWQAVLDQNLPYLVAELNGYVVGYCYASQFRPREGYRFTVEDSIYVRPDCTGYGVGKMLLGELIAGCQARECHSMVACICGNNVPSTALHASLGFATVGVLPEAGTKFGEWLRLLIMQRALCDRTSKAPADARAGIS
jgi:L-amino acid N-acyltransferase YncA